MTALAETRPGAVQRLLRFAPNHPRSALCLVAVICAVSIVGVSRLRVDASLNAMFPQHNPAARALGTVLTKFSTADELLLLVSLPATDPTPDPQRLIAYGQRFERAVAADMSTKALCDGVIYRADADGRKFVEHQIAPAGLLYLNDAELVEARHRLTLPAMRDKLAQDRDLLSQPGPAAGALGKALMQDPLALHDFLLARLASLQFFHTDAQSDALVSADGRSLLIRIIGQHPVDDLDYSLRLTQAMAIVANAAKPDGLAISFGGSYAIAATSAASIRHDAVFSIAGSVALLLGVFLLCYRRPIRLFHLAFLPVAIGTLWGFGAYGFVVGTFSPLAAVVGGVLAGMGIDYSVLFLTRYESIRSQHLSNAHAAVRTLGDIGPAIFAAWITSIAGFLATGASSVKALRDFSILGSLGLTGCFLNALVGLPALLALLDRSEIDTTKRGIRVMVLPLLDRLGRRSVIFAIVVLWVALIIAAAGRHRLFAPEPDLRVMHPSPNPALDTQADIARRFGSAETMFVLYRADSSEALVHESHLIADHLAAPNVRAAGVSGSYGLATWLPDPNVARQRAANISEAQAGTIVADFQTALAGSAFNPKPFAPYAEFLHRLLICRDAPTVATLRQYPALARAMLPKRDEPGNVALTTIFLSSPSEDRATRDRAIDAVRAALADLPGNEVLTGLPVVSHEAEAAVDRELPRLLGLACVLVALYLLVHFRSLSAMAMALLPTVFGMAGLAMFVCLAQVHLNMINLIALPLLVGIDVDYGIYLVSLARSKEADRRNLLGTGAAAVLVCATSMIAGYISLVTTSIPAVRSLGIVVSVGAACAVGGAILCLCPWLLWRRKPRGASFPGVE